MRVLISSWKEMKLAFTSKLNMLTLKALEYFVQTM